MIVLLLYLRFNLLLNKKMRKVNSSINQIIVGVIAVMVFPVISLQSSSILFVSCARQNEMVTFDLDENESANHHESIGFATVSASVDLRKTHTSPSRLFILQH